ncbi:uncharacterized protein BP01DRAFT_64273 [Aspergillus saccharolyticus JOP 1030-1]|uniref:Azaphilone pigments biosynthesis cluster protein L N-terminal domain-containing protein n=1 Tax=Aspergillus saccharolyticus JOP 1030-1 TaxID=1450539 RepID=A0A318ZBC5_9EURO|nr:hypothetical protein BP01DRAFT_64273 [Aspergillus saccharolyticus JOP 1030-1]PYH44676.1 hypothetical protein BP01DRAFT_64273 [Aspergillus saccharolyticus JOP 1030-1]
MDPLSISSGVAGLIGLALQVAPVFQSYVSNVRSARDDVQAYLDEVAALSQVLDQMYTFLDSRMTGDCFQTTEAVLLQTIKSCERSLLELIRMLRKPVGLKKKLLWHLEKEKVENIIARIRKHNQLFHFSLSVEGWAVLSQTPEQVTAMLQLQMQMSKKMHDMVEAASLSAESARIYQEKTRELAALLENVSILAKPAEQLLEIQERIEKIDRSITGEHLFPRRRVHFLSFLP